MGKMPPNGYYVDYELERLLKLSLRFWSAGKIRVEIFRMFGVITFREMNGEQQRIAKHFLRCLNNLGWLQAYRKGAYAPSRPSR